MKLMKIADAFIEKIRKDYADDISLVAVMGSYVFNETHDRSDLDLFFVPKTDKGYNLGFTFIIDEIGFDLWPISWERLDAIAHHKERITSIVTDCKILYSSSSEDLMRFEKLKEAAEETEDRKECLERAISVFNDSYRLTSLLKKNTSLSDVRRHGILFLNSIAHTLSLLNGRSIRRGRAKLKKEVMDMNLIPDDFSRLYNTVFCSDQIDDIKKDLLQLMQNMEKMISDEKERHFRKASVKEVFDGFFEELINYYNKIEHAYEINDPVTCLFVACEIHEEISHALNYCNADHPNLPDIVASYDPKNLEKILETSREHQYLFIGFLESEGISIRKFKDAADFERHLESL
ncbi:hypothetical protein [Proteiniclasticum sp.]|uniref:hypothetical protein n=1 Tax=Proteiniclasticum sp. TaxID=2053595 RepID=UPI0028989F97|nr:hypothetical protein [Proteiniclasticum sp.]